MNDMDAILDLTPSDYSALLKGYRLQRADEKYSELEMEQLRGKLTATEGKGKNVRPKYKSMKEIFDYEKEIKTIMEEDEEIPKVSEETVQRFRDSKAYAEQVLNARRGSTAVKSD